MALSATAQGLIGQDLNPRFGCPHNYDWFYDFPYDTAQDIFRTITALSFVLTLFVPLPEHKKRNIKVLVLELIGLSLIPIAVDAVGTFLLQAPSQFL